ncbi:MAG: NAD(P)-dependent oxidoreductase [Deltaproteobacteria bacterium]|nr:NAD(P)-dependent oxidoreductase [Deltaproteobacteria bacterium]
MARIAWIGTGIMGASMCGHLMAAGHEARIFNRTRSRAADLERAGARWCESPAEAAQGAEFVFTMVGLPSDVDDVVLGPDGVLESMEAGGIFIDMTTSSPDLAAHIYEKAAAKDVSGLDAPVSGGDVGAREATLAIMVGGERRAFDRALPLFELMGKTVVHMGGPGAGQHTKMSNQILIASTMIGVVESLLYASKAGLDRDLVVDVIGRGAAASWSLNTLGRRITSEDFSSGFLIRHFIKDMGLALDEARRMGLALPGLALVHQFYMAASAMGMDNLCTQALYTVCERLNGRV